MEGLLWSATYGALHVTNPSHENGSDLLPWPFRQTESQLPEFQWHLPRLLILSWGEAVAAEETFMGSEGGDHKLTGSSCIFSPYCVFLHFAIARRNKSIYEIENIQEIIFEEEFSSLFLFVSKCPERRTKVTCGMIT